MRTRTGFFLLSAVVVLAGCSPGSPSGPSSSVGPTAAPTITTATSTPSPTPPAEPQTPADLLAYIQAGSPVSLAAYGGSPIASFSTPSGNISCGVFGPSSAAAVCFIDENSWPSVTAQMCNDHGDWTDRFLSTSSGGVRRGACMSQQPFPMPGNVLPYGSTISNGSVACRSESAFLACAHPASGNGFVIARAVFHTYGTVLPPQGN